MTFLFATITFYIYVTGELSSSYMTYLFAALSWYLETRFREAQALFWGRLTVLGILVYAWHTVYLPDVDCFLCRVFSVLYCSVTLYYYTGTSVHERPCSRTNFPSKKSRMTNGASDYEHASWQQRLATSWEYRRGSVSCWLTLARYTSLLEFAVPSLECHCVLCFFNILLNKTPWDQRRIMNKEIWAARACTILRTGLLTCVT
jgi:hypothetical protein